MSILTRGNLIGLGAILFIALIFAILWLTRDKSPGSRRPSAKTSHRAPRPQRLGGGVAAILARTPAPVPVPAANPFRAIEYPRFSDSPEKWAATSRRIDEMTGTTSRLSDTSAWAAISAADAEAWVAEGQESAPKPAPEPAFQPAPAPKPQPVLTIEDAPAEPVLDDEAEKHLTAFLDAHDEQDAAEDGTADADADPAEAEKDRVAFETGGDQ